MNRLIFLLLLRCLLPGGAAQQQHVALVMDSRDNLYGEHLWYEGDATGRFGHFEWVLHPDGSFDTVVPPRQAYVRHDFSLARARDGTEYYLKLQDTTHIYRKAPDGPETVLATGSFGGVPWLFPQPDGSLLYFVRNGVFLIWKTGEVVQLATGVAGAHPSFSLASEGRTVWGLWQDSAGAVYAAVFSDGKVKRINRDGSASNCYTAPPGWTPAQGMFDRRGALWVLECSEKNEVRLVRIPGRGESPATEKGSGSYLPLALLAGLLLIVAFTTLSRRKRPAKVG